MLPLPSCAVSFPETIEQALELLSRPGARVVAGGTDLLPNLKRGLGRPSALVSLARLSGLDAVARDEHELRVGARVTLAELARSSLLPASVRYAASLIASPQIRNVATIGGNLLLDTRCVYVNQSPLWREGLGHCLKADGTECHVVPTGKRCVAAASADLPPILVALGASVRVASKDGVRTIPVERLFSNDGAAPIALGPAELLVEVVIPRAPGTSSAYRKLRVRKAIDFPLLGVAVAVDAEGGLVRALRVVASCIGATPRKVSGLDSIAVGKPLDDATIEAVAERCHGALHPQTNIAADVGWRRAMIPLLVTEALHDVRDAVRTRGGDDGTA
ncbi:MAG: FAD binding domain-containing protein [Sandaracinaceae bacterium]|nr:FAD binding domain-containing protein [Sandaracinaceae bacterium]